MLSQLSSSEAAETKRHRRKDGGPRPVFLAVCIVHSGSAIANCRMETRVVSPSYEQVVMFVESDYKFGV